MNGGGGGFFGGPHTHEVRRKYNLNFTVAANNVFNVVNLAQPNNVLSSPNFDKSLALAGQFLQSQSDIGAHDRSADELQLLGDWREEFAAFG